MILPFGWKGRLFMGSLVFHRLFAKAMGKDIYITTDSHGLSTYEPRRAVLELMSREIERYTPEGSCAEVGVYRGDFARLINRHFPSRKLYLFDTFEGFDERDAEVDRKENFSDAMQNWSNTSVDLVLGKMPHPNNCIVRKGWFPETAEGVDGKFCFVSLDTDLYQPILAGLEFFYPRLVHGGVIMIHDFISDEYNGVRPAVKEFCDANNVGYVCLPDTCGSAVIVK